MLLALTELAGVYCKRAIETESALPASSRILFPEVHFDRGLEQFSEFEKLKLLRRLAMRFWQRTPEPDEERILLNGLNELVQGKESKIAYTPIGLQGACAQLGTSLEFILKH